MPQDGSAAQPSAAITKTSDLQLGAEPHSETSSKATLHPESMLTLEYEHASRVALQTIEDRTSTLNQFFVLSGVLVSAVGLLSQLGASRQAYHLSQELEVALLILAGALSSAFFARFIRIRRLYRDSLAAMEKIRRFYIKEFSVELPDYPTAFHWSSYTVLMQERLASATTFVCHTAAVLASLYFGAAAVLSYSVWTGENPASILALSHSPEGLLGAGIASVAILSLHLVYYWASLIRTLASPTGGLQTR